MRRRVQVKLKELLDDVQQQSLIHIPITVESFMPTIESAVSKTKELWDEFATHVSGREYHPVKVTIPNLFQSYDSHRAKLVITRHAKDFSCKISTVIHIEFTDLSKGWDRLMHFGHIIDELSEYERQIIDQKGIRFQIGRAFCRNENQENGDDVNPSEFD